MMWIFAAVLVLATVALVLIWTAIPRVFLDANVFKPAQLIEKETVTHNTKRFRFAIPRRSRLGLPIGQHISFKFVDVHGREVMRPYTPVTGDETRGHVDFVIKVYAQGRMSQHLDQLQLGDTLLMRGPKGRLTYNANMKKKIGMIAGGTGITPMYQVAKEIVNNPADKTELSIVFANVSIDDIILRRELDELAAAHPEQVHLHYVLDEAPVGWLGSVGYVTSEVVRDHCPHPGPDNMLFFCGPRQMVEGLKHIAKDLGFTADQWHAF